MKPIRLTQHAKEQCEERGATEDEVRQAVTQGSREPAKKGRYMCQSSKKLKKKSWLLPFTRFISER